MHEAMTDLIMLMGKHGFQLLLRDLGEKLEWLVSGCPQQLVLSSLSLLLLPSAHHSL